MSHVPPVAVAAAARKGLELRAGLPKSRRGGTEVGIARARDLANRRPVSDATVKRMKAYFDRHAVDASGKGWGVDSKGWQAWLLWGGDAGRDWATKLLKQPNPRPTVNANREDVALARDGYRWLVADVEGDRLAYHKTRIDAASEANRIGGHVYEIVGSELRPIGAKRAR